jgi:hypothetical protein
LTLHNTKYNKETRKLQIEKIHVKNKKVTNKWSSEGGVSRVGPYGILKLHLTTEDALVHSIIELALENIRLKNSISELEDALSLRPLFVEPLSIIVLETVMEGTPSTSSKVKKSTK